MLCKLYKDHLKLNAMEIIQEQETKNIKNNYDKL